MPRREIRITGYGGQGVIMTGYVFGCAAALFDSRHSTMTQNFGPEARGSACAAALVLDDDVITYPYLRRSDILVALSREGYEKYVPELKDSGILVYDEDLVEPEIDRGTIRPCGIPAARFAEELGKRIVQNIVVVGYATAATEIVSKEAIIKAIEASVPEAMVELNLKAFEKGYDYYHEQ